MKPSDLLTAALDEMTTRGWTSGDLLDRGEWDEENGEYRDGGGRCCALGALGCAAGHTQMMLIGSYEPFEEDLDLVAALEELYPFLPAQLVYLNSEFAGDESDYVAADNHENVYEWNDASTEEQVRAVFRAAADAARSKGK